MQLASLATDKPADADAAITGTGAPIDARGEAAEQCRGGHLVEALEAEPGWAVERSPYDLRPDPSALVDERGVGDERRGGDLASFDGTGVDA